MLLRPSMRSAVLLSSAMLAFAVSDKRWGDRNIAKRSWYRLTFPLYFSTMYLMCQARNNAIVRLKRLNSFRGKIVAEAFRFRKYEEIVKTEIHHIKKQLEILEKRICPVSWASEKYGIDFDYDKRLAGRFMKWASTFENRKDVMGPTFIDRFSFELFLQYFKLVPLKYASIHLGMTVRSFENVLRKMDADGEFSHNLDFDSKVIEDTLVGNLIRHFPKLDGISFVSQTEMCQALHEEIENEYELEVEKVFCETSKLIDEPPYQYAYEFDALTLEPMSIKYQLWMDLGKPIVLKPDACSVRNFHHCKMNRLELKLMGYYDDQIAKIEKMIMEKEAVKEQDVQL